MPTITKSQRGFLYWLLSAESLNPETKRGIRDLLLSPSNEYVNSKELNFLREKFIEGYITLPKEHKKFLEEYCGKTFRLKDSQNMKYWFSWKNIPCVSWYTEAKTSKLDGTPYQYDTIHELIQDGSWVLDDKIIINID